MLVLGLLAEPGQVESYLEWAAARLPDGQTVPGDDFDHDGQANLLEFALGTDPANPADPLSIADTSASAAATR